ncbi:hypothetical protein CLV35_3139 [Motilibacter peucedani]|uniref:ATP/GTP-binding protein n=1 Tax=Motilibacter peucedani TaxID=598650 RepID=A0A420XLQ1_9ACTN|nr:hypothetical protein [Motilibacter peucedani]RKS71343.1 hypothetical protein CLV35_3139 [Motilibacter peucedani]
MGRRRQARGAGGDRPLAGRLLGTVAAPADRVDDHGGVPYYVRAVTGAAAAKSYRCPGCDQEVVPRTPHVLTWPTDEGLEQRRHWHTPCWAARDRRGPTRRR